MIESSASGNTIGGPTASARNILSANVNGLVIITGASNSTVQGNFIGTDLTGMVAIGNLNDGLISQGTSDTIGGATNDGQGNPAPGTAPGNVISGNGSSQYPDNEQFDLVLGTSDVAAGNLIGLNATGTASLNEGAFACVTLQGGGDLIGGLSPNDRNVITGSFLELYTYGGGSFQVLNNYFGTDITGTIGLDHIGQNVADGWGAISIQDAGPSIVIGAPGAGNVIADSWPYTYHNSFAIGVSGAGSGLVIQANKIGTNATGTAAIPNGQGIYIDSTNGFLIGGTAPGAGNQISGNVTSAITIGSTSGGSIEGNLVGTDATGTLAIPNGTGAPWGAVILANSASNVTIGGTSAAAANVISGNDETGIVLSDAYSRTGAVILPSASGVNQGNTIEGNDIGVTAGGSSPLPNQGDGIEVAGTAIGTTIGGTAAGQGNVISGNSVNGIQIDASGLPSLTPLYLKADGNTSNSAFRADIPVGNAAIEGGVTYGPGVTGEAFDFNDTPGEQVVVADSAGDLAAYAVTLSSWINLTNLPGTVPYVVASYSSTQYENYGLYVNSSGELVFEWYSGGQVYTETSSGADLGSRLGAFQQVAVVASLSTVTFYVNGAAVGSDGLPAPLDPQGGGQLNIGGLSAPGVDLFNGLIDDLSVSLTPLPANVIAQIYANAGVGTNLGGAGTSGTTVEGNLIGTNAAGTAAIANGGDGVEISGAYSNTIGGATASARNIISGNTTDGVEITAQGRPATLSPATLSAPT